jgi:peptidoglycan/LPS O-acetylase OafA/YrhL
MLWPLLGGVRFLLALIVVGTHLIFFSPPCEWSHGLLNLSGFAAVLGFLIISGFSIAASYEKSRKAIIVDGPFGSSRFMCWPSWPAPSARGLSVEL